MAEANQTQIAIATQVPERTGNGYKTHGMSGSPTHRSWKSIKQRCYNSKNKDFYRYGGRGIVICSGWRNSFQSFLADLGEKPDRSMKIERIDNNGHYSCGHCEECVRNGWPANCRWATAVEQSRNTKRNIILRFNGRDVTLMEYSQLTGEDYWKLIQDFKMGRLHAMKRG